METVRYIYRDLYEELTSGRIPGVRRVAEL